MERLRTLPQHPLLCQRRGVFRLRRLLGAIQLLSHHAGKRLCDPGQCRDLYIPDALIHAVVENDQDGWLPRAQLAHNRGALTLGGEARLASFLALRRLEWGGSLPAGVTPDYRYYEYRGGKNMFSVFANETYPPLQAAACSPKALVHHTYRLHDEKYLGTDFKAPYRFFNPKLGANYQFSSAWQAIEVLPEPPANRV